jgi:DNA-binding MarR family transcriptional regulator
MFYESKKELEIGKMWINRSDSCIKAEDTLSLNIRNDIISGLKGRMILTLIEIAHQYPAEANHASLCKKLDIPPSTLSNQIKKLVTLDYLENSISPKNLHDARYRNYRITMKGISFLHSFKKVLDLSIKNVEELIPIDKFNESSDEKMPVIYI